MFKLRITRLLSYSILSYNKGILDNINTLTLLLLIYIIIYF